MKKTVFDEVARSDGSAPRREPTFARDAIASTPHPFVTECALEIMRNGGNAIDAAIGASAVMMCVVPLASHFGGDAFCLVHTAAGAVHAINGSGAAPAAATLEYFRQKGGLPEDGLALSTVPGIAGAWSELSTRFGKKPLLEVLKRAISYAHSGAPVTERSRVYLENAKKLFSKYPSSAAIFLPDGKVPAVGTMFYQKDLARTFERVGTDPDDFYRGDLARQMASFAEGNGGLLSAADFARHTTDVGKPLSVKYRGYTVYSEAPVSRGIVVLLMLNTLKEFDLRGSDPLSAMRLHLMVEAYKLAMEDAASVGDPREVDVPLELLLSSEHSQAQAARIKIEVAGPSVSIPSGGGTESAVFGDGDGNVVAYIQSIYMGCGVVMGGTGILMNARMNGFSLDPQSPNVLAPRKRPLHTLQNYLVHDGNGELVLAGGSPGGELQAQINVQVLSNVLDYGMSVTEAVDQPRFALGGYFPGEEPLLRIESRVPASVVDELRRLGHRVQTIGPWEPLSGVATHVIARDPRTRIYSGAAETRRADAIVSGF